MHRTGDALPWRGHVEGCTTWFEMRRDDTDLGHSTVRRGGRSVAWGGTKETGVLTRALAGSLRFRQTSSAPGRTFVGPLSPSDIPFLPSVQPPPLPPLFSHPLCHPLGVSRDLVFRGAGSPVRVASYRLRRRTSVGYRLPFRFWTGNARSFAALLSVSGEIAESQFALLVSTTDDRRAYGST